MEEYVSKYYEAAQIDQRLLQGYYDDAVQAGYRGTKAQFLENLAKLISIEGNYVVDLGLVNTSGVAENAAKAYASNPNVIFILYRTSTGNKRGIIRQNYQTIGPSNPEWSHTWQYLSFDGKEYVRKCLTETLATNWHNITVPSRIKGLVYTPSNRTISLQDVVDETTYGSVQMPLADHGTPGLMSAEDKKKLDSLSGSGGSSGSETVDITSMVKGQGLPYLVANGIVKEGIIYKIVCEAGSVPRLDANNKISNHISGVYEYFDDKVIITLQTVKVYPDRDMISILMDVWLCGGYSSHYKYVIQRFNDEQESVKVSADMVTL